MRSESPFGSAQRSKYLAVAMPLSFDIKPFVFDSKPSGSPVQLTPAVLPVQSTLNPLTDSSPFTERRPLTESRPFTERRPLVVVRPLTLIRPLTLVRPLMVIRPLTD